jgi:hypothetical protein
MDVRAVATLFAGCDSVLQCFRCYFVVAQTVIQEVLPKAGLVYSEKGNLSEVLCKPKIMPIKSTALQRLEALEKEAGKAPEPAQNIMTMAAGGPGPDDF